MIPMGGVSTKQTTTPFPIVAPTGGLNGRDPIAAMPPTDAYIMDNIIPRSSTCESRQGCEKYTVSALGAPVQTLDVYSGASGDKMLAWAGTAVYDVTTGTPSNLGVVMNSAIAVNAMFSNAADNAQHLISVTGFDVPKHFDGATLTDLAITGVTGTASQLNFVFAFKGRLYFGQRDKLGFYYLPTGQIQGAVTYYDLAQVSRLGGYLVAIASYSHGGDTPQDFIVFITSKGECIVFEGSDPGDATAWGIVGRYFGPTPIGPKCAMFYNNELTLLTLEGALPFSLIRERGSAAVAGVEGSRDYALTAKLGKYFTDLIQYSEVSGWQGVQYPAGGMLVINAPISGSIAGDYHHYVMDTTTRSWCRFTDWNGITFCVFNKRLYFGRYDGYVMLADEGRLDDGLSINVDCAPAYSYFADDRGNGPLQKHFQWANLIVSSDATPALNAKFSVDFKDDIPSYVADLSEDLGASWDVTDWDVGIWGGTDIVQRVLVILNKAGYAGSLRIRVVLPGVSFKWYATQFALERTNGLLI